MTELSAVRVPGPRVDLSALPHVLEIVDHGDGLEKEWTVEHPADCALACHWYPPVDGRPWFEEIRREFGEPDPFASSERDGLHHCLLQWELDSNGIDSLAVVSHRVRGDGPGGWVDVAPHADPAYVPETQWEAEWKRLRPGRYLIEAWYTPGGWAGDYYDADGGINLLGLAP